MKKIFGLSLFALTLSFVFASVSHAQHYVESGDTMYKIAYKNNMTLKDIINLNPHIKDPNLIHAGEYIIIRSGVETQKDLADYARSLQDVTAYKYGGNNFPYETDCSGFAKGVFEKFGVNLPRVSRDQAKTGQPIKFENLQIGDLMFFSTRPDNVITHTGIYLGQDFWISNLNEKEDVKILSTWGSWAQDYFMWGTRHKL